MALLCPGQGAQSVGMGRGWFEASPAAAAIFAEADAALGDRLGAPLSTLCFSGPVERLNATDVSQPAIYTCSVACHRALVERGVIGMTGPIMAAAGLSLGEYTALHLAGAFDFATGLRLVAERGRLMQEAAVASAGGMLALIGADEAQAEELCAVVSTDGRVLVCANFNAPGQIVLSGHAEACDLATAKAAEAGLRTSRLTVAGAFHSPLMQPAADRMAEILAKTDLLPLSIEVWSNVTAEPHDSVDMELLRRRLVQQIVEPVRWSQSCASMIGSGHRSCHELAPGSVLRGLMKRIDRTCEVINHDQPEHA